MPTYIKNTVLVGLMVAVVVAAVGYILRVLEIIPQSDLNQLFTKGGLVLLIMVAAMILFNAIKGQAN